MIVGRAGGEGRYCTYINEGGLPELFSSDHLFTGFLFVIYRISE